MQKYYKMGILAVASSMLLAGAVSARDGADDPVSNTGEAGVIAPTSVAPIKNREQLRANEDARREEIRERMEQQKAEMGERREEAKQKMEEQKELISQRRDEMKDLRDDRLSRAREMKLEAFKIHQSNIVRQLNRAVENLMQVRERINDRIVKAEQSGRNMSEAKTLLITADAKIALAKDEITKVVAYEPIVSTSTSSSVSTSTLGADLVKAREVSKSAIEAIKTAKEALRDVVLSIAKNMGLRIGQNATSTATSTN